METTLKATMNISETGRFGVFVQSVPRMLLLDCENE